MRVTSETRYSIRTYILLALNLIGAILCISVNIVLTLTAAGVIFIEENTTTVLTRYLDEFTDVEKIEAVNDLFVNQSYHLRYSSL